MKYIYSIAAVLPTGIKHTVDTRCSMIDAADDDASLREIHHQLMTVYPPSSGWVGHAWSKTLPPMEVRITITQHESHSDPASE